MPTQREIAALRNKVLRLPDLVKFELYEELRADLISTMSTETLETRRVREGREALTAIRAVVEETGLDDAEKLPARKFDEVSRRLELEWSSARIIRLYGTWRRAIASYRGDRYAMPLAPGQQSKRRQAGKSLTDEQRLDGLRAWLKTKPAKKTIAAYDTWVSEHNAGLSENEQPFLRGASFDTHYLLGWKRIVEVAEGKITLDQARQKKLAETVELKKDTDLTGIPGIALFLGLTERGTKHRQKNDKNFPIPVVYISGVPGWLVGDVRLYKRSLSTPDHVEGGSQADYMDLAELRTRLGKATGTIREQIQKKRWDMVPEPDGYLGIGHAYWRRAKTEKWLEKHDLEP